MKFFAASCFSFLVLFGCSQQPATSDITSLQPPQTSQTSQTTLQSVDTQDRSQMITNIKFFAEKSPLSKHYQSIKYVGHEPNPDTEVMGDKYDADGDTYIVTSILSLFTDKDVNRPKPMGVKIYTQKQLEVMVKKFIEENDLVDFTKLSSQVNQKGDNYFFSWEYKKGEKIGSIYPRVQVGIRKDGWLFSYENILND